MSDHSSPPERVSASVPPAGRSTSSLAQLLSLGLLAAAMLVLTANVWLLGRLLEQRSNASREHLFWVLCQPGHTQAERDSAFRQLVRAGNKEWRGAQLSELNLEGMSLPEADLKGAGFQRTVFARANLTRVKMSQAALDFADLTGAD